jgi:hypothetical protein
MPASTIGGSFRILSARQRRACARAGRRDGRAGLPAGEPKAGMSLPGADAVTGEFTALPGRPGVPRRRGRSTPTLLAAPQPPVAPAPAGTAPAPTRSTGSGRHP